MTLTLAILVLGTVGVAFGFGVLCGYWISRSRAAISVMLPGSGGMHTWADDARCTEERLTAADDQPTDAAGGSHAQMHHAAADPDTSAPDERRTETRHPYCCLQWMAPYNGSRTPEPEEFFRVQCRDISSGGISFFLDREPKYHLIVIRLFGTDGPRYLTARIRRSTPCENHSEHGRYTVGCQFLSTLHRDALTPHLEAAIQRYEQQMLKPESRV